VLLGAVPCAVLPAVCIRGLVVGTMTPLAVSGIILLLYLLAVWVIGRLRPPRQGPPAAH